jgi:AraC family transcriptional regulator
MNNAVECAIVRMWEGYSEPLSLADIAKSAILSRFHFSRVFRAATGVSPGRFLSAVRIYEAKRMLASTTLSVTEISLAVGYNSLGSFTNRFTDSVGVSPSRFRRMWQHAGPALPLRAAQPVPDAPAEGGRVTGSVELPPGYARARVYVGAFSTPIVQCQPPSWTMVTVYPGAPVSYQLADVPAGEWHIRAVAVADSDDPEPWTRRSLMLGGHGSITMTAEGDIESTVVLRPRCRTDLPILLAIPELNPAETEAYEGPLAAPVGLARAVS